MKTPVSSTTFYDIIHNTTVQSSYREFISPDFHYLHKNVHTASLSRMCIQNGSTLTLVYICNFFFSQTGKNVNNNNVKIQRRNSTTR